MQTINLYDKEEMFYSKEELEQIRNSNERLVYVDTGDTEFVARYKDLPDIIIDINEKFGSADLNVYDFENPDMYNPLLSTFGPFLNKCNPQVREDIIDRLNSLLLGEEKIKAYKIIDEDMIEEMER